METTEQERRRSGMYGNGNGGSLIELKQGRGRLTSDITGSSEWGMLGSELSIVSLLIPRERGEGRAAQNQEIRSDPI